jgi:hypothetical protein
MQQTPLELTDGQPVGATEIALVRTQRRRLGRTLADLETAIAAPIPDRPEEWWNGVRAVVLELQRAFADHVAALEGDGGLHDEILWHAPRLSHTVDRLQRDHDVIRDRIVEYLEEVDSRRPLDAVGARRARYGAMGLIELVAKHRQRGADAVFEAFMIDLGSSE